MKAIIIETATQQTGTLQEHLHSLDIRIEILASFSRAEEALSWFRNNPQPDLLFMELDPDKRTSVSPF